MFSGGTNETLQTIRAAAKDHPELEQHVTFVAFNSREIRTILNDTPINDEAQDIKEEDYRPGFCTPLFDAMGLSICNLKTKVVPGDTVLVTVITDGLENSSREYDQKAIKTLVDGLMGQGWVFTYIGANQDVEKVAMSISIENHISWENTCEGTHVMFAHEKKARTRFFNRIADGVKTSSLQADYFEEDSKD